MNFVNEKTQFHYGGPAGHTAVMGLVAAMSLAHWREPVCQIKLAETYEARSVSLSLSLALSLSLSLANMKYAELPNL